MDHHMHDMNLAHQPTSMMTAVNFCELKISQNPAESLVAFSIGSGIVVSIEDPAIKAGGMLSFVLPESQAMLPKKAERHPYMFADTGLPVLLEALMDAGAKTENIKKEIAGGAQIMDQKAEFNIGLKNCLQCRRISANIGRLQIDALDTPVFFGDCRFPENFLQLGRAVGMFYQYIGR